MNDFKLETTINKINDNNSIPISGTIYRSRCNSNILLFGTFTLDYYHYYFIGKILQQLNIYIVWL